MHALAYVYGLAYYVAVPLSLSASTTIASVLALTLLLTPFADVGANKLLQEVKEAVPMVTSATVREATTWRWVLLCQDSSLRWLIAVRMTAQMHV
jgi:hypothetical protein